MLPDFNGLVREAFAPVAAARGFRETGTFFQPVLQRIVFSNERRVVRFYLDVRDGYLDARYSTRSVLNPDGTLVEPAIESVARMGSVYALMMPEGYRFPDAYTGLYEPGRLEQAVRDLVAGIVRHAREVLGEAAAG